MTVANGQSTSTEAKISQAANAPLLPSDLLHAMPQSGTIVGVDTCAAGACAVSYNPAINTLTDGMVQWFKAKAANTGATTLNVNGLSAVPVGSAAHSALQGGEIIAEGRAQVVYRADMSSWVLIECTGEALQVAPVTQSNDVGNLGQFFSSLSAGGYIKIPNCAMEQFDAVRGAQTESLSIAFPNDSFSIVRQFSTAVDAEFGYVNIPRVGLTQYCVVVRDSSGALLLKQVCWLAIGN